LSAWLIENIGPLMFAGLVLFLLIGYPVAFALAAVGLLFGFVGIELGLLQPELLQALPQRIFGIMQNDTLLAIPFFTFMGLVLERSGMAEDLLDTLGQLSQHHYTSGQFAMSIFYCHKILGEDKCREDVHRRVMLCYLNLDQPHLALRQYHTCVEALKEELDVPPMQATEDLFKQIQRRRHK